MKAIWADPKELHDAGGITLDNRWKALSDALKMPLISLPLALTPTRKGALSIWRVRLTLTWPITSEN